MQILDFKSRVFLAPMAGITDLPMRRLVSSCGEGVMVSEMVAINALSRRNPKTYKIADVRNEHYPVVVQLVGSDPALFADAAKLVSELGAHSLDINMGCPVPKVVNNGEGSALLKNPDLIVKIVKSISSAIQKPLTVKVRIGFENEPVDIVEIAKRVEDAGAAAIAVHGRTRQQYYSGIADWETIARVKEAVSIPVIGNGDVDSPKKAEKLFRQTGCDAVMIGRAVEGNPWIFREMNHYFATGEELARPSLAEVKAMILKHARAQIEMKGEFIGIREMRKHVAWYTAGMPHSAGLRRETNNNERYAYQEKMLERL